MGNIIAFPLNTRRGRAATQTIAGGAKILFFLGVRYSRMPDPPFTASDAPKEGASHSNRNRKRKRRA